LLALVPLNAQAECFVGAFLRTASKRYSGLADIVGNAMVNFTGEGENYMIIQQCAIYLLKKFNAMAPAGATSNRSVADAATSFSSGSGGGSGGGGARVSAGGFGAFIVRATHFTGRMHATC
jgi:uncharacterized membrane protein YgcG